MDRGGPGMPADEFGADRRPADCVEVLRLVRITLEMQMGIIIDAPRPKEEVDVDQAFDDAGNSPFAGITTALRPARG